jgi:hypothetical protein
MICNTVFRTAWTCTYPWRDTDLRPVNTVKEAKIIECEFKRVQWWGHTQVPWFARCWRMCSDLMHECLVFGCPHFRHFQYTFEHLLVPFFVDHSNLRNRPKILQCMMLCQKRLLTLPFPLSYPVETAWLSVIMAISHGDLLRREQQIFSPVISFREALDCNLLCWWAYSRLMC